MLQEPEGDENSYCYLAINVFRQVFRDVECYFTGHGTKDEISEGRKSIPWVRKMKGNFRILASASGKPLNEFHQMCLWKINDIRAKARKTGGRRRIQGINTAL